MRVTGLIVLAWIGLASTAVAQSIADALPAEPVQFVRADGEMKIDGHLDEAAWAAAAPATRFFEVAPGNVEVPAVNTEARFAYDEHNIYVGIRAFDPDPKTIRSAFVRRDQVLEDQDYVEVLLDPLSARAFRCLIPPSRFTSHRR